MYMEKLQHVLLLRLHSPSHMYRHVQAVLPRAGMEIMDIKSVHIQAETSVESWGEQNRVVG